MKITTFLILTIAISLNTIFAQEHVVSDDSQGDIAILSELDSNAALKRKDLNNNVFISYGSLEKELG